MSSTSDYLRTRYVRLSRGRGCTARYRCSQSQQGTGVGVPYREKEGSRCRYRRADVRHRYREWRQGYDGDNFNTGCRVTHPREGAPSALAKDVFFRPLCREVILIINKSDDVRPRRVAGGSSRERWVLYHRNKSPDTLFLSPATCLNHCEILLSTTRCNT